MAGQVYTAEIVVVDKKNLNVERVTLQVAPLSLLFLACSDPLMLLIINDREKVEVEE